MQYDIPLALRLKNPKVVTRAFALGLYRKPAAKPERTRDIIRETIYYDPNGGYFRVDSVLKTRHQKGRYATPVLGLG